MRTTIWIGILGLASLLNACDDGTPIDTVRFDLGPGSQDDAGRSEGDGGSMDMAIATPRDAGNGTEGGRPDGGAPVGDAGPDAPACSARTTCDSGECGDVDDGCGGTLSCGGCGPNRTCGVDHRCACTVPVSEPGSVMSGASMRPTTLTDSPMSSDSVTGTIESATDVDWFVWNIDDAGLDGNPEITVTLTPPAGQDYTLQFYFDCNDGDADNECVAGTDDPPSTDVTYASSGGQGCNDTTPIVSGRRTARITTDCSGWDTDDDGKLYVKVTPRLPTTWLPACSTYNVSVLVD